MPRKGCAEAGGEGVGGVPSRCCPDSCQVGRWGEPGGPPGGLKGAESWCCALYGVGRAFLGDPTPWVGEPLRARFWGNCLPSVPISSSGSGVSGAGGPPGVLGFKMSVKKVLCEKPSSHSVTIRVFDENSPKETLNRGAKRFCAESTKNCPLGL